MTLPGPRDWLFSAKAFAGAMLALYIALALNLDRPYWAMATAYIVAQPMTGAMRSKALYRFLGTLLGATAAVLLVPALVDAPALLSLVLALWTGLCLYFALLDRTPRSYVFMLAGYTAAIIGFPSVTRPAATFTIALSRFEEITLGLTCTTLVGSIVFPRPIGPVLAARIDAWLRDIRPWCLDALAGAPDGAATAAIRQRSAADAVEIGMLTTHLAYDASNLQRATRWIAALQQRMLMLLPILSSITDRIAALRHSGPLPPGLPALLERIAAWIRSGPATPRAEAEGLRAEIARLDPAQTGWSGWGTIMLGSLLVRLRELVDIVQDTRDLRAHIAAGGGPLPHPLAFAEEAVAGPSRHRDHGMAALSAAAAMLTILVICAFWIGAAWSVGDVAAEMAAVGASFYAAQDDPAPAILRFTWLGLVGAAVAAVYLFGVLPAVQGFDMLALVFAPVFLVLGALIAMPATYGIGMGVAVMAASLLSLQSSYAADAPGFVNGAVALVVGMGGAALITRLVRSVGAEWSARRLLRAGWADLAAAASRQGWAHRAAFTGRMLDRLGLLAPRLGAVAPGAGLAAADALADLRIGLNVVDLQRDLGALPAGARATVGRMLDALAGHFRANMAAGAPLPPPRLLLGRIDAAIAAAAAAPAPTTATREILLELVGIRRGLFPDAEPYRPGPPPAITERVAA